MSLEKYRMKLDIYRVRGVDYQIEISTSGKFLCDVDGERIEAPTLDALKGKINDYGKIKLKNVAIPYITYENGDGGEIIHGICTGIHSGNNNLLVRENGATTSSQESWGEAKFHPKHADKVRELRRAIVKAKNDLEEYIEKHELDLKAMIRELIKAKE
jgi:hypothetical protein